MNKTELAIEHFSYGISHDIYSEPVTTYAKLAVEALKEKQERDKGCKWCETLRFNPDIGDCQLVFYKSKTHPNGVHAISVSVFDEYGEEQEPTLVQIDNCIHCGKRLEVKPCG